MVTDKYLDCYYLDETICPCECEELCSLCLTGSDESYEFIDKMIEEERAKFYAEWFEYIDTGIYEF